MEVNKSRIDALLKKIEPKGCPLCGKNEWIVGEYVFCTLEYYKDGDILKGGQAFPIVPLTCSYCGNTYFLNAFISGIIDAPKHNTESSNKTLEDSSGKR